MSGSKIPIAGLRLMLIATVQSSDGLPALFALSCDGDEGARRF